MVVVVAVGVEEAPGGVLECWSVVAAAVVVVVAADVVADALIEPAGKIIFCVMRYNKNTKLEK